MGNLIEPRMLGFVPTSADLSVFSVASKTNAEYKIFDSDGKLYTPDGGVVSTRLDALEAGIPPIDDARIVVLEDANVVDKADIATLQGEMVTAQGDITAVEGDVTTLQADVGQAQTDITNLQGDMTTAQGDIVALQAVDMSALTNHIANSSNPHTVTAAQAGADATGTAAAAIVTHVAVADPHAQYLKEVPTTVEVGALPMPDANNYFATNTLGEQMQEAGAHIASTANPHSTTKAHVGLGNVNNESKSTMFDSPTFTGVPLAPTADVSTDTTQIATTAFVKDAIAGISAGSTVKLVDPDNANNYAVMGLLYDEGTDHAYGIKLYDPVSGYVGGLSYYFGGLGIVDASGTSRFVITEDHGFQISGHDGNILVGQSATEFNAKVGSTYVVHGGADSYLKTTATAVHSIGVDTTGPYYIKNSVKTYF